jgi:hypothetical protein
MHVPFRHRLKAPGVLPSREISQFRELAQEKCAAVLTHSGAKNQIIGVQQQELDAGLQVTASVPSLTSRPDQHHLAEPTMNRDDVLVWLSFVWFVALCGAAIWVLFPF